MSLLFRIVFTFLFLLPNLKAEDLKDCEWDNRDGVPCLTISKTSNTSAYNNGNVLKKFLTKKRSKQLVQKIHLIFLS